ncbi:variant erythrocyte surface antigen-1 family protein [Babesia caballi]|uniref:Variant erythrocyte surface antigen-1 family protein n=1 Tax=Babesia caballi TaxID=5871 RepID=A0AAV4M171_BABCB|nr:variant erythrocyte surface antigen-1 family protein [Babesia caballi]
MAAAAAGKPLTDCPSNLKEAIDWILRVTGKDGGQGGDNTSKLAVAVRGLLEEAYQDVHRLPIKGVSDTENQKVKEGLRKAMEWIDKDAKVSALGATIGPITKLSDGLAEFIGYKNFRSSVLSGHDEWKLTGAGIAPPTIATHRLCDATIAFTIGVLESLAKNVSISSNHDYKMHVDHVISGLEEGYGKGVESGLKEISKNINRLLNQITGDNSVEKAVKAVGTAFQSKLGNATDATQTLAGEVGGYLDKVFKDTNFGGSASQVTAKLQALFQNFNKGNEIYNPETLEKTIRGVKYEFTLPDSSKRFARDALYYGRERFMKQLEKGNYTSYYSSTSTWQRTLDQKQNEAAKIFLSCIPFVYYGLSYFCWRCREQGEWPGQKINEGAVGLPKELRHLLYAMGYTESDILSGHSGGTVMKSLSTCLTELKTPKPSAKTYADFIKELRPVDPLAAKTSHPLSVLFLGASFYFQSKRSLTAKPPSTIRTMLGWLTRLSMTPQFVDLLEHLSTLVKDDFKVAVSGLAGGKSPQSLSADDLAGHLITTCLSSSWVLGTIQGRVQLDKPLLHEVFSSTEFSYPSSGPSLFNTLSNYTYALQFQFNFLLQQCRYDYSAGCGWKDCKFGSNITPHTNSHLCPKGCSHQGNDHTKGDHSGCEHDDCSSQGSPLQAFLTDQLKGFSRGHHSDPSSHLATCSGYLCHVPMGFDGHLSSSPLTGKDLGETLHFFCGDSRDPLRQLCEKLGCLTKRTPRTLADLFGFMWHLNGQLFNTPQLQSELTASSLGDRPILDFIPSLNSGDTLLKKSLGTLQSSVTFWDTPDSYGLASHLASSFYNLNRHCHQEGKDGYGMIKITHNSECSASGHSDRATDLWSILRSVNKSNATTCASSKCGGYLSPLTYSSGATFTPNHASAYLSWLLYLTDDLYISLQAFLNAFNDHKCADCKHGCSHSASNLASQCECPNVVECAEVRPLLYTNGFNYGDALSLKGGWDGTSSTKRRCADFSEALKAVLANNENTPLFKLLTTIDTFLYAIRWEFFSKLSVFWTIYICLILYTFVFRLDTVKLLSFPLKTSSHPIAPAALLTTGKPIPVTKLTYLVS